MRSLFLVLLALGCLGCTQTVSVPSATEPNSQAVRPASITRLSAPPGWKVQRLEGATTMDGTMTQLPTVVLVPNTPANTQLASR